MTGLLLLLVPFLPLAMAVAMVAERLRRPLVVLLPVAPLPALFLVVFAPPDGAVHIPQVLLGLVLGLDEGRRLLLLLTGLLWLAAAVYSRGYLAGDERAVRYSALFLATMGGNLGLIVALDVASFYVFFSLMTLCSYILVVHDRTEKAYRAGRIYLVLSVLGETLLLLGFLRAVSAAQSLLIADIGPALADERAHMTTILLLFAGFAIKAGQFPLHVWLPLAHPAAPTPASAVLSGAMIKAGLLGMILFLPFGHGALPGVAGLLMAIGSITAFYGVAAGIAQRNPKTILAYSSLSQMGLMVAALGVALAVPAGAPGLLLAVTGYAVHHGLAKAALFFSVGVVRAGCRGRVPAVLVAGFCGLAIAGLPVSAGALVKTLLKSGAESAALAPAGFFVALLPFSAVATSLLMLRFLVVLAGDRPTGDAPPARIAALLWTPFAMTAVASQLLPWLILTGGSDDPVATAFSVAALREGLWPLALATLLFVLALWAGRRTRRMRLPAVPEGDCLALLPTLQVSLDAWSSGYSFVERRLRPPRGLPALLAGTVGHLVARAEGAARSQAWGPAAAVLVLASLLLAALLMRG